MVAWMAYAVLVACLLLVAAWAAERVLVLYRRPTRSVWAGALLGAVVLPVAVKLFPGEVSTVATTVGTFAPVSTGSLVLDGLGAPAADRGIDLDALLAVGWGLVSALLLIRLVAARIELASKLANASQRQIGQATLYLTSGLGPAVAGVGRGQVVLPRWLWKLGPQKRRLAVLHEQEHIRAGDPWLLMAVRLVVVLLPWNLPLWWGLHRLRCAVEADCDRRVLRRGADPGEYGDLLLQVGERRSLPVPGFAALVERASNLERRIRQMTQPIASYRGPKALLAGTLAMAAMLVACESPTPANDSSDKSSGEIATTSERLKPDAEASDSCEEGCAIQVTNRFEDRAIEVYVHEAAAGEYVGDVAPLQSNLFALPNANWPHVQLSIREASTHKFISLECVRQFSDGVGIAVVQDSLSRERCD